MADSQVPLAEHDFLMLLRQGYFLMISAIEQRLGKKPTTKQKLSWWKQRDCNATHTIYPDYETDET